MGLGRLCVHSRWVCYQLLSPMAAVESHRIAYVLPPSTGVTDSISYSRHGDRTSTLLLTIAPLCFLFMLAQLCKKDACKSCRRIRHRRIGKNLVRRLARGACPYPAGRTTAASYTAEL